LERAGVSVKGKPGAGKLPQRLSTLATVRSAPLAAILSFTERTSNNFFAEMLGKLLGASTFGPPGTISKGARAIEEWVRHHGATAVAHDSSGLSLKNRISPKAIVTLLAKAQHQPWGAVLREGLAAPGEGTLGYRMVHLDVRAKTGTLFDGISALSGWVRNQRSGHWTAFSILDRDTPKEVEDKIVAAIARAHIAAKLNGGRKCNNNPG
jgi:D-alanyl-D-alanine carboxypeptidase/D-alanyl-D-alanine-endopeptidase (penicillin-binding protein 4)